MSRALHAAALVVWAILSTRRLLAIRRGLADGSDHVTASCVRRWFVYTSVSFWMVMTLGVTGVTFETAKSEGVRVLARELVVVAGLSGLFAVQAPSIAAVWARLALGRAGSLAVLLGRSERLSDGS